MAEVKSTVAMETMFGLLDKWDDVEAAVNRVVTAQPAQMTSAADRLEEARMAMRQALRDATRPDAKAPSHV